MLDAADAPECAECYDENPPDYVERELCPSCPRHEQQFEPALNRILHYLGLLDSGCPVGRHELLDWEWQAVGALRSERERIIHERARRQRG